MGGVLFIYFLFAYLLSAAASLWVRTSREAFMVSAAAVWGLLFAHPGFEDHPLLERFSWLDPVHVCDGLVTNGPNASAGAGGFAAVFLALSGALVAGMITRYRRQPLG